MFLFSQYSCTLLLQYIMNCDLNCLHTLRKYPCKYLYFLFFKVHSKVIIIIIYSYSAFFLLLLVYVL